MNQDLLAQIDSESLGIIWITPEKLGHTLEHYPTFNYLFDGLIQQVVKQGQNLDLNIFQTNNFNNQMYMVHHPLNDKLENAISQFIDFLAPKKQDSSVLNICFRGIKQKDLAKKKIFQKLEKSYRLQFFSEEENLNTNETPDSDAQKKD